MPPRTSCLATGIVQTLRKPFCRNQIKKKEGNLSLRNLNILNYSICPDKFVSRLICAIALCIPTVLRFTRKVHAHIREQKISCSFFFFFFFFQPVRKTFIATWTDLVTYHLYLWFAIERKAPKNSETTLHYGVPPLAVGPVCMKEERRCDTYWRQSGRTFTSASSDLFFK